MITGPSRTVKLARKVRAEMTLPETLLWRRLRERPGGFKFSRRHPVGTYSLDFYCAAARLAVEVDGFVHDTEGRAKQDDRRKQFLHSQRVATLRVPAKVVLHDIDAAVARIVEVCAGRVVRGHLNLQVPFHPDASRRGPPPSLGGGMNETAYAKINLALHVRRRRADGYHELETVFAFVDDGDVVNAEPAARDEVRTVGEFAPQLADPFDNIVGKALTALPRAQGLRVTLDKRLPVAAGLGGGSADAGALFRLVERMHGLPSDWRTCAARLGADVPACVASVAAIGRGTGTELAPVAHDLAGAPVLLVNPRVPLATGPVFAAWDGIDRGALPEGTSRAIALAGRNDLEPPAIARCPAIAEVLAALRGTAPWLARMSGSGATCFALYNDEAARDAAAAAIAAVRPEWWRLAGRLR